MLAAQSAGPLVLDNSAWARIVLQRLPGDVVEWWARSADADRIQICDPFRLGALCSARSPSDFVAMTEELDGFRRAPADAETWRLAADAETWRLAADAQSELAADRRVSHRVKIVDLLVAASAHQHRAGVLHYDGDFGVIARYTSLAFGSVWIAARGTIN